MMMKAEATHTLDAELEMTAKDEVVVQDAISAELTSVNYDAVSATNSTDYLEVLVDEEESQEVFKTDDQSGLIKTAQFVHIGTRDYQQDALFVSDSTTREEQTGPPTSFAILCDGMGGTEYGAEASSLVVREMAAALSTLELNDDVASWLYNLVRCLDVQVFSEFGAKQAGTTIVAVYLRGKTMDWVSAGDSRIYIARASSLECLTRDHNLQLALDHEIELGKISIAEAESIERRDSLISFLGHGELPLIDYSKNSVELFPDDIVLLCSDGLTKSLSDDQIESIIREESSDLYLAARRLVIEAFDTGGEKDNASVVLMQYLDE